MVLNLLRRSRRYRVYRRNAPAEAPMYEIKANVVELVHFKRTLSGRHYDLEDPASVGLAFKALLR